MNLPRKPRDGRDGRDGKDADPALIRRLVAVEAAKAVAALPKPKDGDKGEPGRDGKDVDPDDLRALVDEFVARADALRPIAKDGTRAFVGNLGEGRRLRQGVVPARHHGAADDDFAGFPYRHRLRAELRGSAGATRCSPAIPQNPERDLRHRTASEQAL